MFFLALWSQYQEGTSTKKLSKAALLSAYKKSHDGQYVVALLERIDHPTYVLSRIIVKYIRKETERDDFIQELYEKLCHTLKTAEPHTNLDNWIKTIVRNTCLNYLNRADNKRQSQDLTVVPEGIYAATPSQKIETSLDLQAFLEELKGHLNEKQWLSIEKRFIEGKGHKESADEMGLTPTQFRGVLNRSVEKLRATYGEVFWAYVNG
jgi:RNA polymerase sigma-70 factor (ECF subfamily)